MISTKKRVANAVIVVALLLVVFTTRLPAILLTPDHELWLLSGESTDSIVQRMRLALLDWRGADLMYEYGKPNGYSTLEMAVESGNFQFIRRYASRVMPQERQSLLGVARTSGDQAVVDELEKIFKEVPSEEMRR